jgi:hypothetical protein
MALTYREQKGSALTIQELDANFQYFTGSHAVTGSQIISGSLQITGSLSVSGSHSITGPQTINGSLTVSGSFAISGSDINLPMLLQNSYANDAAAAAAGIALGGLYRNGTFIQIRIV